MDNLLNKIKELVEAYNNLPNAKKMVLIPEEYAKNLNVPISNENRDVSDVYICVYDDEKVGLFKELKYCSNTYDTLMGKRWDAGSIFMGIESCLVGMKVTHKGIYADAYWEKEGSIEIVDDEKFVCNCNIKDAVTFDDMRLMMYEQGELSSYHLGKATNSEMLQVLKFAKKHYEEKNIVDKQKIK